MLLIGNKSKYTARPVYFFPKKVTTLCTSKSYAMAPDSVHVNINVPTRHSRAIIELQLSLGASCCRSNDSWRLVRWTEV
ncbi:hypothetical protein XELAEV_18014186mg [Xenopus laevis]|uniref:Uncharacterized protein n=1 Tax=Xenopus laevis TaxID=8355 RepID=A0A974DHY1_XENLA|nr:hypothetical protein XELAEV_18014186mg [Xenopus laevis]